MYTMPTNTVNSVPDFLVGFNGGNPVLVPGALAGNGKTGGSILTGAGVAWANRPNAVTNKGLTILVNDFPVGGSSQWISDGANWRPVGGRVTVSSLPGPYSITGGTVNLIGFPTGSPKVPAGMLIPGSAGSRLRIVAEFTKIGAAGALAGDIRFGTSSSFTDSQLCNLAPMTAAGANAFAEISMVFPTTTTCESSQRVILSSGFSPSTGYYPGAANGGPINTAADMYANFGYNSATVGDGINVKHLLIELFQ